MKRLLRRRRQQQQQRRRRRKRISFGRSPLSAPSTAELRSLARKNHFELSTEETRVFKRSISDILETYSRIGQMADARASTSREGTTPRRRRSTRILGQSPTPEENKFGAWAWKCSIRTDNNNNLKKNRLQNGRNGFPLPLQPLLLLSGKKIAVKDNVSVAGLPMRCGSPLLDGFVSSVDATIVKRILAHGGEIVGKATCEDLCVSGGSHTSYPHPVRNPRNEKYMAGGSSSGSAALLAAQEVDMAIGGDQAGSIRIPSSWCGVYGLKPTRGLVPYTGIIGMDPILDHVGPMANSVLDVALLLEAIAGRDGLDPNQLNTPLEVPRYSEYLGKELRGLKIGIVREALGWNGISEKDVDDQIRESAFSFQELGAKVAEVSIPEHRSAIDVWTGIVIEGAWHNMIRDNGLEHHWSGEFDPELLRHWAVSKQRSGNKLAESAKLIAFAGSYMAEKHHGIYYGLARNLRSGIIAAYDRALQEYDLLVMPTTPQKALPLERMSLEKSLATTVINLHNTCAFDVSGHPALNVPCGESRIKGEDGGGGLLPYGLMLVGKYFDECQLLNAAYLFEKKNKKDKDTVAA